MLLAHLFIHFTLASCACSAGARNKRPQNGGTLNRATGDLPPVSGGSSPPVEGGAPSSPPATGSGSGQGDVQAAKQGFSEPETQGSAANRPQGGSDNATESALQSPPVPPPSGSQAAPEGGAQGNQKSGGGGGSSGPVALWEPCNYPSQGIIGPLPCADGAQCICKDESYAQCRTQLDGSWTPPGASWQCQKPGDTASGFIADGSPSGGSSSGGSPSGGSSSGGSSSGGSSSGGSSSGGSPESGSSPASLPPASPPASPPGGSSSGGSPESGSSASSPPPGSSPGGTPSGGSPEGGSSPASPPASPPSGSPSGGSTEGGASGAGTPGSASDRLGGGQLNANELSAGGGSSGGGGGGSKATFTSYGGCNRDSVACGSFDPGYNAAVSQSLFGAAPGGGAGPACGKCFKLTADGGNSITVKVNDLCPVDGNPICALTDSINFDLCADDGTAAAMFGGGPGQINGTYAEAPCP